jgi:F0F1-type ATP synthase membrane subunit b/b'
MTEYHPRATITPSGTTENNPAKIAKMEAEIDQTRNAISGDLRTLGERLSPENLKYEAKEVMTEAKNVATETLHEAKNVATSTFHTVKEDAMDTMSTKVEEFRGSVRDAEHEAIDFLRANAIPLAMMGVGAAWFFSNRRTRDERWDGDYRPRGRGRWRYPEPEGYGAMDEAREGFQHAAGRTQEAGQSAKQRAGEWAEGARHQASDAAGHARDFAGRELDQMRGMARDARDRL